MNANQVQLLQAIANQVAEGKTPREAFEAVIGAGAWEKMAGDLFDAIRAARA